MKRIFLLFVLVITLQSVQAQDVPFIDFGPKIGVNYTWIRNLPSEFNFEQDAQIGFVGGVFARIKIPLIGLYVQPEAVIAQQKAEFSFSDSFLGDVTAGIRYTNLDIPILIGQRFGFGPLGIRANVGPVFSTVLSAKTDARVELNGMVQEQEEDISDIVDSFSFGIQVGVGVDISKFNFDLRYQHTFSEAANLLEGIVLQDENQNFSNLQFTLGYKIL